MILSHAGPLRWLVLDEADRLLDLGFEARLKEIVSLLDQRSALTHTGQVCTCSSCIFMGHCLGRHTGSRQHWNDTCFWHVCVCMFACVCTCVCLCLRATQGPGAARRTTALLSATLHSGLGALATMSLKEPVAVGFTVQQVSSALRYLNTCVMRYTVCRRLQTIRHSFLFGFA